MAKYYKLWWALISIVAITFGLLGYFGHEVYRSAPPIPKTVMSEDGSTLMTKDSILDGQTAWQSVGGMQLGSIWGHGAYQAPDWTADWLHRELISWLELAAIDAYNTSYEELNSEQKNTLQFRLKQEYRKNSYDKDNDSLLLSRRRAEAIHLTADYYIRLFGNAPELQSTRNSYAMKESTMPDI